MTQVNLNTFRSERDLGSLLGWVALAVIPVFLVLLAVAKSPGLTDPVGLEHAQLARHLARGDGFVTSVLRPLTLAHGPACVPAPDVVNAPGHPLLLAGVYRLAGASDRATAITGAVLWLACLWLTVYVGRRWWDGRAAGLAAALFVCTGTVLSTAVGGLPFVLIAIGVGLATYLVLPAEPSRRGGSTDLPVGRLIAAGLVCGAVVLTDYALVSLALVLAWHLARTSPHSGRALGWFGLGLAVIVGPWFARNALVSGEGFLGAFSYGALSNTRAFPGGSVWRSMPTEDFPVLVLLLHPRDLVKKLVVGLEQYWSFAGGGLGPVTGFLVLTAVFSAPGTSRRGRLARLSLTSMGVALLVSAVVQPDPRLWLAWTPLLAGVAAAQLVAWTESSINRLSLGGWQLPWHRREMRIRRIELPIGLSRGLVQLAVVLVAAFPLITLVIRSQGLGPAAAGDTALARPRVLPEQGMIMTDDPARLAWQLDRPVVELAQQEATLDRIEAVTGKLAAVYLSPAFPALAHERLDDWWLWAASSRGVYRDLAVVQNQSLPGLLRRRTDTSLEGDQAAARVEEARAAVRATPSAEAHAQLAQACLSAGRLREAHQAFHESVRLDPYAIESWLGLWQVQAQVSLPDVTLRMIEMVARSSAQSPQGRALLEQAADHFDEDLARSAEPWLLVSAIGCRVKLGQWQAVEAYYTQLGAALAGRFPSRLLLANLYYQQGATDQAAAACEQLLTELPDLPTGHQVLGRIRQAQGRFEEALHEYQTTLRLRPQWVGIHLLAGRVSAVLGRYEDAAKQFQAALELQPRSIEAELSLAEVRGKQGRKSEAMAIYSHILKTHPRQPIAVNNLAEFLVAGGQAREAVTLLQPAVAADPQNPILRDTAGWACFMAGDSSGAVQHLREAIRLAPQQATSYYRLGKVLLADHRLAEAQTAFATALERGLKEPDRADAERLGKAR